MSSFDSIYNTQTIKIMDGLYSYQYDDPFELRRALEKFELFSFSQELWQAVLTRYPCETYLKMLERCEELAVQGKPLAEAASVLPKNKQKL